MIVEYSDEYKRRRKGLWSLAGATGEPSKEFEEAVNELFQLGFDDGQGYVYKVRSMVPDPDNDGEYLFPGDEGYDKATRGTGNYTITTSGGKTLVYRDGKLERQT